MLKMISYEVTFKPKRDIIIMTNEILNYKTKAKLKSLSVVKMTYKMFLKAKNKI